MVLEDADGQDIVQMNALAEHPHEHRCLAELQADDHQRTDQIERGDARRRIGQAIGVALALVRIVHLKHLNPRRRRRRRS